VYDSTGEVFCDTANGRDAHEAIATVAAKHAESDLEILGALPGDVMLTPACEDSGKCAAASDLAGGGR